MNWSNHTYSQPNSTSYVSLDTSFSGGKRRASFTGKELDEETGYGYFGARYMDHELMTGWLSVDPMADKYPSISPYAYCTWNPVKLVDPDGEEIHLTFYGKSTISIFNSIIEKGLGNQFKASYSKNSDGSYTFSLKTTEGGGDISKLNKYQKAFYEELSDCIKGTDVANIAIVSGLSSVHIGNYRNNQVDIADVQQFDDIGKGLCTKQGKLIHEFREQYQKACLGYRKGEDNEYNSCHQYAIISENHVNGSRRGKETYAQGIVSQQYSNGGHVSTYSYSTQKPLLNPTKNAILKVRKY